MLKKYKIGQSHTRLNNHTHTHTSISSIWHITYNIWK